MCGFGQPEDEEDTRAEVEHRPYRTRPGSDRPTPFLSSGQEDQKARRSAAARVSSGLPGLHPKTRGRTLDTTPAQQSWSRAQAERECATTIPPFRQVTWAKTRAPSIGRDSLSRAPRERAVKRQPSSRKRSGVWAALSAVVVVVRGSLADQARRELLGRDSGAKRPARRHFVKCPAGGR